MQMSSLSQFQTFSSSPTNIIDQQIFTTPIQITLLVLAVFSSVISLLLPALYYVRKKCTQHPSELMAIISLLQALSNYNIILIAFNIYNFQHFVHIQNIFDLLMFYTTEPSETNFCEINFTIYIALQLLSIAYNIAFSADLLITLKKPFFAGKKRMKFYHFFALVFVSLSLPMSIIQAQEICNNEFHTKSIYKIPKAFIASLALFYIISFIIIIMSFRSVQTSQIRKKYIHLHRIILLSLLFLWVFPLITNIMIMIGDQDSIVFHIFNILSFASLLLLGGMINIVRFYNDPYLWLQIKQMVCKCKCRDKKKKISKQQDQQHKTYQNDIWNLPLAHAVSTFHHQSVISNIIQIVLQTCVNTPQQQAIQTSQYHRQPSYYQFGSSILGLKEIKKLLKTGNKQQVKRLTKITKSLQMLCLDSRLSYSSASSTKNIYKTRQYNAIYSQKNIKINDSDTSNNSDQIKKQNFKFAAMKDSNVKTITIKVKSYADPIFLALRLNDGYTSQELSKALNLTLNAQNIKKARESLGASGSFFFFSYDNRLVIKTITQKQCQVFLRILPQFYEHIVNNSNSLISRAYGLFSVEIAGISKIYFIMMQNTLKTFQQSQIIYKKYDLKGSTIKRQVKNIHADVFKDINLLKSDDAFLLMSPDRKKMLLQQIKADITLLKKQNIMDYSLLLGIGYYKKVVQKNKRILHQSQLQACNINQWRCFDDGHEITGKIYSLSLIDYLQEFDWNKYMQLKLKKVFKGGGDISSVDTETYFERFIKFVSRIIVVVKY